jgi:hypothetical protein
MWIKKIFLFVILGLTLLPVNVFADTGGSAGLDTGPDYNPRPSCKDDAISLCTCFNSNYTPPISRALSETTTTECISRCQVAGYKADETSWACVGTSQANTANQTNTAKPTERNKNFIKPILNVPIPGLCKGANGENCFEEAATTMDENGITHTNLLGTYVAAWYKFLLIAASIVAVTMLAIAGLQYATAAGNTKQVEQAKKRIWNAISGMILLLLAYNIAFLVDPKTTAFKPLSIRTVPGIPLENKFLPSEGIICTSDDYLNTTNTWQKCMLNTFGKSPSDFNIVTVDFFGKSLEINEIIADKLYKVMDEIQKTPELANYNLSAETAEGSGFIWRCNTTDKSVLSFHSWGMALDINPSKNPYCLSNSSGLVCVPTGKCENLCTSSKPTDIPQGIVDIFKNNGFDWGGDWSGSVKDYMHFQAKTVCEGGEIGK